MNSYATGSGGQRKQWTVPATFDSTGEFLLKWSTKGGALPRARFVYTALELTPPRVGDLRFPEGIAVDDRGNIYVVASGTEKIGRYSPQPTR